MPHGYIFDVPADGGGDPAPIRDMGRFSHEAVAVDHVTGFVYETEDAGGVVGLLPVRAATSATGRREGGRLFMLKVATAPLVNLGASYPNGTTVAGGMGGDCASPTTLRPTMPGNFVWAQGRAQGAATFARLEGCWYGNDRKIYIVSTNGGIGQGQIWVYDPREETIRCCSSRRARRC